MTFVIRHPILILSIIGTCVLSYLVYAKATEEQVRNDFRRGYGNNAPLVGLTKVVVKVIADDLESVGTTVANESVNLTAAVSETISRVAFEDGEFVERGDILVELTSTAEASRLAEAQANVDDAKRQLDRLENLSANNLVADNEFDQARTALETAKARLKGVLVDMDDRLVRAPFSGYLGFRNVSEGSLLTPGSVITTLDDVSKIKLDFSIPEIYLADIAVGQTIKAKSIVYEERDFEAEITVVGSRIDPVTRGVAVRAQINNNELLLRPGMLMTVSLALNEESVMVVPESAVIASQGIQFVYRVDADNKVLRKQVELGRRREGQVEIRDGLDPGDRVVSDGVIRVRPGITVRPQDDDSESQSD